MKIRPKNRIVQLLLLFLSLLFLPLSAKAAYAPNAVDSVKALTVPMTDLPSVELRMPKTLVKDSSDERYPVYIEINGLPKDTECWLEVTIGDSTDAGAVISDGGSVGLWLRFDGKTGAASARVSIYSDEQKAHQLYEPILAKVFFVENLLYTAEDAAAFAEPETFSMYDREVSVTLAFPKDISFSSQNLQAVLLDENNRICGHSQEFLLVADDTLVEDTRYNGIFKGENPYRVSAQLVKVKTRLHRALDAGDYTLKILDGAQAELCIYDDLFLCVEQPKIEISGWAHSLAANRSEGYTAAVQLRIAGGNPNDFIVELWRNRTRLGVSEAWQISEIYGWRQGALIDYEIPLNEPLDEGSGYWVKVLCDQPVFGELEAELPCFVAEKQGVEAQSSCLESSRFASFLIPADGFVDNRLYRLQLMENGILASSRLTTPADNGWFDIGFVSDDGTPLHLQNGKRYQVTIAQWTPEGWEVCAATKPVIHEAIKPTAQAIDATQTAAVTSSCVDLTEDGIWSVTLQGEYEVLSSLEHAKLLLVAADGTETLLSPHKVAYSIFDTCLTLNYCHDSSDFSWYGCSLMVNNRKLVDSNDEPLLAFGSAGCYSDSRIHTLGVATKAGTLYYGVESNDGSASPRTLRLYPADGSTKILHWTAGEDAVLDKKDIPASVSRKPARAAVLVDGIPALMTQSGYWFPRETALSLAKDSAQDCQVGVTCEGNGRAVLYYDGQPLTSENLPPLSEIYVHAMPDEGYEVACIQVNQTAMGGRSFLLSEDTQVDVIFRKCTPETFAISLEYDSDLHHVEGGSIALSVEYASVEDEITLTATVQAGYVLDRLEVVMENSRAPVPLKQSGSGWQFSMPAEPVRVIGAIRPLYQPVIQVEANNAYGVVTVPETAVEGRTVKLIAVPHPASRLERLELVYYSGGKENRVDLLPASSAENTYAFLAPATSQLTVQVDFAQPPVYPITCAVTGQGSLTVSADTSIPTETVTLAVTPAEGYRLVKDSLQVQTVQADTPQALPLESGGEGYTFRMPWGEVTVTAAFEPVPITAPGGTVTTQTELYAALGGSLNAAMAEDGCTVRLVQSVELQQPLVFRSGGLTLDVGSFVLTTGPEMSGNALVVEADASLHITGTAAGGIIAEETAVYVCGGSLTVESGSFSGTVGLEASAQSALHLRGGSFAGAEAALRLHCPVGDCLDPFVVTCHPENGTQYDDQWVAQTTVADAVCFVQSQPAFADNYATAQTDPSNIITVTADVTNPTGDSLLLAALYGEQGQLIAAAIQPCARGDEVQSITLCFGDAVHSGRLYLLDKTTYKPLAKDIPIKIQ